MDANAASLYSRFTGLKSKSPGLQTWISVGGWSFTDPGPTRTAFSSLAGNAGNRRTFISGLMTFMNTYGFDGVDLDWEYPAADDRGGVESDTANYGIQDHVDWFNLMAYDLHGTWDAQSIFVGPYIAPHTNITEIDAGLDLLWRAGVSADKVVMGEGWYGRSFTLKDPSCNTPNGICQFTGGANAGPCSNAVGILDYQEIQDIIKSKNLNPVHDQKAGLKWISWDSNQWVSFDDEDTFKQKRDFANSRCLGGLMVWAMDQMDQTASNGFGPDGVTSSQQADANQQSADQQAGVTCYTSACGEKCKKGTNQVAQMNGQPGQTSTSDRCPKGKYENLCCDDGTITGHCLWQGFRGAGLSCIGGCASGETEVARNTNHHDNKGDQTCNGGLQSYCCEGFKPAPSKAQLKKEAADAAKSAAEAAAENAALDLAAKAFCRVAVPALLAPLELLEDLIPIFGEIADIAEIAATPALIQACVKGIEKEGKAEFKVFGKKHTLSFDKPTEKPRTRPPQSSHSSPKTSSTSSCAAGNKRAPCLRASTTYETTTSDVLQRTTRTCSGNQYTQACFHYRSVISENPGYGLLTCPYSKALRAPRPATALDEYPPADIWQDRGGQQWIRLIPRADNGGAGAALFGGGICSDPPRSHLVSERSVRQWHQGNKVTELWSRTVAITRSVLALEFAGMQPFADDGLPTNPCYPSTLVNDPGFALLWEDEWYDNRPLAGNHFPTAAYAQPPAPQVTQGKQNRPGYFRKRAIDGSKLDPSEIVFDDGNSTRKATEQELFEEFNFIRCKDEDCSSEREALGIESAIIVATPRDVPTVVKATTTLAIPPTTTQGPLQAATVVTTEWARITVDIKGS
ncbi:MAG: hypothetical protein Q9195_007199 [Heterodermia aff. obscurata]